MACLLKPCCLLLVSCVLQPPPACQPATYSACLLPLYYATVRYHRLANEITNLSDAATLYPLFGLGANLAQFIAGLVLKVCVSVLAMRLSTRMCVLSSSVNCEGCRGGYHVVGSYVVSLWLTLSCLCLPRFVAAFLQRQPTGNNAWGSH